MSNHIVGESMNYLTKAVFEMHDQKEISTEAAHKIIKLACDVVGDCDGNRSEAFWSSIGHRCACCFRADRQVYNLFELAYCDDSDIRDLFENIYYAIPFSSICEECFIKMATSCKDAEKASHAFEILKKYPFTEE